MACRSAAALLLTAIALARSASTDSLPQDRGAAGTWQRLLKLQTTASAMHTTAHPDDEHGGVLTKLGRGSGARVALTTLTRGESGDNAIGPELFDAVGLIRTEELRRAGEHYGLDRQYFTTAIDYGFSKRLDEALEKWGRDTVLGELVEIIRIDRPLVIISRFQGNERDGHGNHQAAGAITLEAFKAAGDPNLFPDQIARGLRPWRPLKLYVGGVRETEDWTLRFDSGEYSPWLGDSYANIARTGLAFQRSQNGGRVPRTSGGAYTYYKRLASLVAAPDKETSFFDGIDTRLEDVLELHGRPRAPAVALLLTAIAQHAATALRTFNPANPGACVPPLIKGLKATRDAIEQLRSEPDVQFDLRVKEQQFQDAINAALGIEVSALAERATSTATTADFGPLVAGETFRVSTTVSVGAAMALSNADVTIAAPANWRIAADAAAAAGRPSGSEVLARRFTVTVPVDAPASRPAFSRRDLSENRYTVSATSSKYRAVPEPLLSAVVRYSIDGVPVEARDVVRRLESNLPYGDERRELAILPALAVNVTPQRAIVPLAWRDPSVNIAVEIVNNLDGPASGRVKIEAPAGWTVTPTERPFAFGRAGERTALSFSVAARAAGDTQYSVRAGATNGDTAYGEGYDVIQHRDLETRYLFKPAASRIRGVDVQIAPDLSVGYVMGVGDEVPAAIAQLGARVQLLSEDDLRDGNLGRFAAIVTGTRAYAVRGDLRTYNRRLLDYVRDGGHLIVLYNTQEYDPERYAPYAGQLTARAEEVSEEDSPVTVLQPAHPVLNRPNRITRADFDGWVEQRGSKFWSRWDQAYTPLVETHDRGQAPQRGGWLWARFGKGHYTYFAYAFHRQLPYAVPGAYRLLANLLSLGKTAPAAPAAAAR